MVVKPSAVELHQKLIQLSRRFAFSIDPPFNASVTLAALFGRIAGISVWRNCWSKYVCKSTPESRPGPKLLLVGAEEKARRMVEYERQDRLAGARKRIGTGDEKIVGV